MSTKRTKAKSARKISGKVKTSPPTKKPATGQRGAEASPTESSLPYFPESKRIALLLSQTPQRRLNAEQAKAQVDSHLESAKTKNFFKMLAAAGELTKLLRNADAPPPKDSRP